MNYLKTKMRTTEQLFVPIQSFNILRLHQLSRQCLDNWNSVSLPHPHIQLKMCTQSTYSVYFHYLHPLPFTTIPEYLYLAPDTYECPADGHKHP